MRSLRLSGLEPGLRAVASRRRTWWASPDGQRLVEAYARQSAGLENRGGDHCGALRGSDRRVPRQGSGLWQGARLLDEQFARLSAVEQTLLFWLAILREPVSIEELLGCWPHRPRVQVLEAIEALRRRSLIERGQRPGSFTLQSVVLEYVTARLIARQPARSKQGQLAR